MKVLIALDYDPTSQKVAEIGSNRRVDSGNNLNIGL
jgi:hypothetical protein